MRTGFGVVLAGTGLVSALATPAGAARRWTEVRSPHFVVLSDGGAGRARRAAARFEQIRAAFGSLSPRMRLDAETPLVVFAARSSGALEELLPDVALRKEGVRPAGLFVRGGLGRYIVLIPVRGEEDLSIVYHEYVHHLLDLNFEWLPVWAAEGLAEFYAYSDVRDDEVVIGRPALHHLELLRTHSPMPFEVLLEVDHTSPQYGERDKASLFYAQSWATIHYFMLNEKGRDVPRLGQYMEQVRGGAPSLAAAQSAFGDLEQLRRQIQGYAHQNQLFSMRVSASLDTPADRFPEREVEPERVDALVGDLHLQRERMVEARERLERALATRPALAPALTSLGALEWREGHLDRALERLDAAVGADPDGYLAQFLRGQLLLTGGSPESREPARAALERSIASNPDFARSRALLASLLIAQKQPDAALEHAKRAVELEPGRPAFRTELAVVLTQLGQAQAAQTHARIALLGARTPGEREALARRMREATGALLAPGADGTIDPALQALQVGCAEGDQARCVDLAESYWTGAHGSRDGRAASALLGEACRADLVEACARLAEAHCEDPERTSLLNEPGWGCFQLAGYTEQGEGVERDPGRVAELYDRACGQGFLPGCARLARLLEEGQGVPVDAGRAAELYAKSCEADDAWACTRLGGLYASGQGVERDVARAEALYSGACDAGEAWACARLGDLLEFGKGGERSAPRAHAAYERACQGGFQPGCERQAAIETRFPSLARE